MTARSYDHVRLDIDGNVATITFDAPRFRNALGIQAMQDVIDIFDDIEADKEVGAVVLTGTGDAAMRERGRAALPRLSEIA